MNDMELITRQEPGLVEFYNFEDLKTILEAELLPYRNVVYGDQKEAEADQKKLKKLKKTIDDSARKSRRSICSPTKSWRRRPKN